MPFGWEYKNLPPASALPPSGGGWKGAAEWILRKLSEFTVGEINKRTIAEDFSFPIEPVRDGLPDYDKYIKQRMDLATVRNKLN